MKRTFIILFLQFIVISIHAQHDIIKFMGIPVDGSKTEMVKKLIAKGFVYQKAQDYLDGEFNGSNVHIYIVTYNNKVCRIIVENALLSNESDIKIEFNNLCWQFDRNKRYTILLDSVNYKLPDSENISYQMTANNKRYEAKYYQLSVETTKITEDVREILHRQYSLTDEQIDNPTKEQKDIITNTVKLCGILSLPMRPVWFMIQKLYNKYKIIMFYDNEYNRANGEDL